MIIKKTVFHCIITISLIISLLFVSAPSVYADEQTVTVDGYGEIPADMEDLFMEQIPQGCSDEYKTTGYYKQLWHTRAETTNESLMERVVDIALSQEGYKNYATEGQSIRQLREKGWLWTGEQLRMNNIDTGNTEYTRWFYSYVMGLGGSSAFADSDWCSIFASWCMYHAGYRTDTNYRTFYYSYSADPRIESGQNNWITSFNFDQNDVWYTSLANQKLNAYSGWNTPVHKDISPYDIPYKPGGLIFFSWDGTGEYFNHVGIVVEYNDSNHTLVYISGNDDGMVMQRHMKFDVVERFKPDYARIQNANRIMAYAEYSNKTTLDPDHLRNNIPPTPVTPPQETSDPVSSQPVSSTPAVSSQPESSVYTPVSSVPEETTYVPVSSAPASSAPTSSAPASSAPASSAPTSSAPASSAPASSAPASSAPASSAPASSAPASSAPASSADPSGTSSEPSAAQAVADVSNSQSDPSGDKTVLEAAAVSEEESIVIVPYHDQIDNIYLIILAAISSASTITAIAVITLSKKKSERTTFS